ncbi:hypothetical protein ACVIHH_001297 [Bradyrhizobium sp. USDA 4518]|uniref:Uncharacterized protein n=1 Tax=Bradyrhizobium brasilense TaxID=1419277 RepID=A0ABY8J9R0_9BRAD|nr:MULTISPECIES: hypothetical protein [Bradyrhizobium]MCP1907889.1 hypothetical protein [Bradyrhizobium elkanii]MCP1834023.1 hypothetical protein [Bradyrhizobium sp. USDA 4545]MCP1853053.1 hypothetical protein [Bradyrhizobium sp. USDA 4541]MCP1918769.1 hypothetical protein [Bradyrhizobium sp. USDA 4532]WFU61216.1 hypothetical protein QA636_27285 [Bradyrhizobium brasilense]
MSRRTRDLRWLPKGIQQLLLFIDALAKALALPFRGRGIDEILVVTDDLLANANE